VTLAPAFEVVAETGEQTVWCLAGDEQGNLYAGTGNEGKVLKIDAKRNVSVLFDSPEVGIQSLVLSKDGTLYAGSSPDGMIYRIPPKGEVSTFCKTGERYIWSLVLTPDGNLYAGTGDKGKILKISPKGEAKEVYRSKDGHVMSLILDRDGKLYAGTEGNGFIYTIDGEGKGFLLYDAPEREVRAFALGTDGTIYAAAMSGQAGRGDGQGGGGQPSGPQREGQPPQQMGRGQSPPQQMEREGSAIYRIATDGTVSEVWDVQQPFLFSFLSDGDGNLIAGAGESGILYRIVPATGRSMILGRIQNAQPLTMYRGNDETLFVGTGNAGTIHRLTSGYARTGTLVSDEHDFGVQTRWGRISWRTESIDGTKIAVQTRSGNTADPDETWSPWSEDLTDPAGNQIPSPPARFLQYRVTLSSTDPSKTPTFQEITAIGLPSNLRPVITSFTSFPYRDSEKMAGAPRPEGERGGSAPSAPGTQQKPTMTLKHSLRMIKWQANDPNDEPIVYSLYVKGVDEKEWKVLEKDLRTTSYLWDTESSPDGITLLKLVASDRINNPDAIAMDAEHVSEPFEVDNTSPEIGGLKANTLRDTTIVIEGKAEDVTSFLQKGEYSIDNDDWRVFLPKDIIFDGKHEEFAFPINGVSRGEHTIVVRVYDTLGNVGSGKITVDVK
jgi:hypothetical protein